MLVLFSRKTASAFVAVVSTVACHATNASAQEWSPWDGPRMRAPEAPSPDDRYDNRYVDPYDQGDVRRYDDRRNGDRDYDDRRDDGRGYSNRDGEDRGYDDRGNAGSDYYDDREAPPEVQAERSKTPGADGGPRPYISPVAPPLVAFSGSYAPRSVVIDTGGRKLYYVVSATSAYAYPIGVGRQGFTWTGTEKVSRIADWPDWYPPADMRQRKPGLPERMLGGIRNPLGVKAIYLGNTLYRIHGTNEPKSIGKAEIVGLHPDDERERFAPSVARQGRYARHSRALSRRRRSRDSFGALDASAATDVERERAKFPLGRAQRRSALLRATRLRSAWLRSARLRALSRRHPLSHPDRNAQVWSACHMPQRRTNHTFTKWVRIE